MRLARGQVFRVSEVVLPLDEELEREIAFQDVDFTVSWVIEKHSCTGSTIRTNRITLELISWHRAWCGKMQRSAGGAL